MAKTTKKTSSKTADSAAPKKKAAVKKAVAKKAAAKKATVKKKATSKKAVAKKAAPRKKAAAKKAAASRQINTADRRQMIAEAAYLRGESQGFLSDEREDWLLAEAEVDALLAKSNIAVVD